MSTPSESSVVVGLTMSQWRKVLALQGRAMHMVNRAPYSALEDIVANVLDHMTASRIGDDRVNLHVDRCAIADLIWLMAWALPDPPVRASLSGDDEQV